MVGSILEGRTSYPAPLAIVPIRLVTPFLSALCFSCEFFGRVKDFLECPLGFNEPAALGFLDSSQYAFSLQGEKNHRIVLTFGFF